LAPFYALKYAPPAMGKTTPRGSYPNAVEKDRPYGSIVVVSSVASTYGGEYDRLKSGGEEKAADVRGTGCWGPCYTMSSHAALGVVRAGVGVLKGMCWRLVKVNCTAIGWTYSATSIVPIAGAFQVIICRRLTFPPPPGTGVRINCISPGQIDIGIDLKGVRAASNFKLELTPLLTSTSLICEACHRNCHHPVCSRRR
jgi:NAD(P)-dependent dehydrogenase (short-subunit alcohol dehydrogenase family)